MAADVVVMECPRCGRLWVGSYEEADARHSFSEHEMKQLAQVRPHAHAELGLAATGQPLRCYGTPESVRRPEVIAAYQLGGKEAAEAMADSSLRRLIEERQARGT